VEAVWKEEVKLQGGGRICERGRFKPGMKERWSYRCTELLLQSGE